MPQRRSDDQLAAPGVVPMLPCADIDEMIDFYTVLGFERSYRQTRPNPYAALKRGGLQLHFFGIDGFDPEQSYGTCGVYVPDTGALYQDFADRMRGHYGKVLVAGRPRITRPRKRHNVGDVSGFSVIDPGGNWIRIFRAEADGAGQQPGATPGSSKLGRSYRNAVVIADSHGDEPQAAKILDSALRSVVSTAELPADADLVEVLLYRAELALRLSDPATARVLLDRYRQIDLSGLPAESAARWASQSAELVEQLS